MLLTQFYLIEDLAPKTSDGLPPIGMDGEQRWHPPLVGTTSSGARRCAPVGRPRPRRRFHHAHDVFPGVYPCLTAPG